MIEPIYMDALVFSSLLTLLSIGLTMTYLTTRVPNFAHGSLAMIGTYVSLTVDKVFKASIYQNLYLSFIASGLAALTIYLLILKPLRNRGASIDALMIATLAIDIILLAIFNIYTDILIREFKAVTGRKFLLRSSDLIIFNQRAALIVSLALVVVLTTALYLLLTRTKFGIAMRAVIENPSLAATVGINTELVYSVSWFIAGGLAGISGGLLPLWFLCDPAFGSTIVVSIFAASIVGGLYNIYGALLGGYLVGLSEILGTSFLASYLGAWVIPYRPLIPLIMMAATLLIAPKGLTGINWSRILRRSR